MFDINPSQWLVIIAALVAIAAILIASHMRKKRQENPLYGLKGTELRGAKMIHHWRTNRSKRQFTKTAPVGPVRVWTRRRRR